MPASDPPSERRGWRLLTILFWAGVGLAPLAALLLLVGQGAGALRVAAVLAVLAVVLIGLSITLRRDAEIVRLEMEETLLEEVDMLREDVRKDIATAARATHKAFGEKLQTIQETVQALRAQVEAGAPQDRPDRERSGYDRGGYERTGYDPGEPGYLPLPAAEAQAPAGPAPSGPGAPPQAALGHVGGRARVPAGVVRHTETVQVTTRQTIVDPHGGDDSGRGTVYGGNGYSGGAYGGDPGDGDWSAPSPPARGRRSAEPGEESWQRGGDGRRPRPYERGDDPADDSRWTGMRAGDRWTSVRSDERGREVRMGERRAAMHADESGSEMRIEDRWAAVRREEPRRDADWRADDYDGRDVGARSEERWDRRAGPAALPAGGIEPTTSWGQSWEAPQREPAGRRRRYRDDDEEEHRWP